MAMPHRPASPPSLTIGIARHLADPPSLTIGMARPPAAAVPTPEHDYALAGHVTHLPYTTIDMPVAVT